MPKLTARFLDRHTPAHISTLIAMTGVSAMAMNMFLPSLPSMATFFQTDYAIVQLSVALFLAVNGILQLIIGPLSDRFGRRPIALGGFAVFCIGTLGCLYAQSVETFLGFRMVQAASVVAVVISRASIRDIYERDEAASMIGYVTMGMAVVPMVTPAIGGYLDQHFGWHSIFWVYLAAGSLMIWLLWADFGETHVDRSDSFSKQIADMPELITSPRFWGYAAATAFSSGAFFAYLGGAPFIGSVIFGLEPSQLGLYFGMPAIGYMAGNFISARYAVTFGINRLILAGSVLALIGLVISLAILAAGIGGAISFFALMILLGVGNGLVIPNGVAGTLSVRPQLAGTASGLGGALMILGGAGLSAFAGAQLTTDTGPYPLLYIQIAVTLLSVISILLVIRRERRLRAATL